MKKRFTWGLALLVLLGAMAFGVGCGNSDSDNGEGTENGKEATDNSLKEIQDKGVLILGCDDEFPPMGFIDEESGALVGFDIDLAVAVAEKLGVTLEAKPIDWATKELELTSGNIDVIWNGYTITGERAEKVTFAGPYLQNSQLLVVRADSDVKNKTDLTGRTLGVQSDSAAESLVEADDAFKSSLKEVRSYDTYQQALLDLETSDRIDAVGVDKILIEYVMQQKPGVFKILSDALGDEYFGIGCRPDAFALRDAIDKALDELYEDGTIDEICAKWFTENIVIRGYSVDGSGSSMKIVGPDKSADGESDGEG